MKISIIGNGIIGSALSTYLAKRGYEIAIYDPHQNKYENPKKSDVVFISVPAPTLSDGTQDQAIVWESVKLCDFNKPIYIRSTVTPGTCDRYREKTGSQNIYSMPEFLTARNAIEDFERLPIIVGKNDDDERNHTIHELFGKEKIIFNVKNMEAELAKYTHNVFGALKVGYFNFIYDICKNNDLNFEHVREAVFMSGLIVPTHSHVPGPDGKLGFGGACFPKDLKAFIRWAEKNNLNTNAVELLKSLQDSNFDYRGQFDVNKG